MRIDIDLATPYSLVDENFAIKIECKIVGEDKYIDNKKTFNRVNSPTNGIMSFISGKYSAGMDIAGMIGFIKQGNINTKVNNIKNMISIHNDFITIKNISTITVLNGFNYSYETEHERYKGLSKIKLIHLFFDFT